MSLAPPETPAGSQTAAGRRTAADVVPTVGLLGGFELRVAEQLVQLPLSAQRVLAFLALHDRPLQRLYVAGSLWLDATEERANASLRTVLWRLGRQECSLVETTTTHVALACASEIDVRSVTDLAHRLLADPAASRPTDVETLCRAGELLPDWYEDWVLIERERFRQVRLHALEALCIQLASAGRFAEAADAGLAAVRGEVLRESAHRALIRAYIAEGNFVDAIRQYRLFRDVLRTQLGLEPSPLMSELVAPLHVS